MAMKSYEQIGPTYGRQKGFLPELEVEILWPAFFQTAQPSPDWHEMTGETQIFA